MAIWFAEHVGAILVGGAALGACAFVGGGIWTWRRARKLDRRPLTWVALLAAVVLTGAGALGMLVAGAGLVALGPGLLAHRSLIGEEAPELTYTTVADGAPASLADLRGRVVLLNVWATWCPPCVHELPALDRLQQDFGERGLVVLQVSDEDRATLSEFLERNPMGTLHGRVDELPWPDSGRPTTFLVDREGVVRKVVLGARRYEDFERIVSPYL